MGIPGNILEAHPHDLGSNVILMGWRGSIAHGMYQANVIDDKDVMGVVVPPIEWYLGYAPAFLGDRAFPTNGTKEIKEREFDIVVYELRKMIALLAQGNPNVLSLLWLEPNHYLTRTAEGDLLVANRHLFASKHVYHSFTGYAYAQLHKMTHLAFEGYMGEKRKALVQQFGYDTKNAAHLIRLLRMGIEFLTEGELHVFRQDAPQLMEIKRGEWSLERVQDEAQKLFNRAEEAHLRSPLPAKPDAMKVNALSMSIFEMHGYTHVENRLK